jgi:hypothetical protein
MRYVPIEPANISATRADNKAIKVIDRETLVSFLADFLIDPKKNQLHPGQYKEILYVENK